MFEFSVDGCDIIVSQSVDSSQDLHFSCRLLIVDVFNDETHLVIDVVVRTNVIVNLDQLAISLGQVHATLFNDSFVVFVGFSFYHCLRIAIQRQFEVVSLKFPFWHDNHKILSWTQIGLDLYGFGTSIFTLDPPVARTLLKDQNHSYPTVTVRFFLF